MSAFNIFSGIGSSTEREKEKTQPVELLMLEKNTKCTNIRKLLTH
jgi:hypothetical protein